MMQETISRPAPTLELDDSAEPFSLHLKLRKRHFTLSAAPLLRKRRPQLLLGIMWSILILMTLYIFHRERTAASTTLSQIPDSPSTLNSTPKCDSSCNPMPLPNPDGTLDDRPLVLYVYHEDDISWDNAMFFLKHGLHDGADFIFIINGRSAFKSEIPVANHIMVIQRENTCFDIGAYGEVLRANTSALLYKYKRFILMNSSVRGPFMPTWSSECWTDAYLSKVTETNKLVGISMNCRGASDPHVQAMFLAIDRTGLEVLIDDVISPCFATFDDRIRAEINMTTAIIKAGYTVTAFMTAFSSDPDYTHKCDHKDILHNNSYYEMNIHPYESIFHRANRNIFPHQLKMLTKWHEKANYSSQPYCGINRRYRLYHQTFDEDEEN
ncbi:hypothetical protein TWF696_008940 [Orbilia brochopaga]|uniref:Uncharacterized protein n=1 Tax=Orbilia brochopaga TaxID=3140254 RepID=A0AAV9UFA2_9PEZI